MRETGRERVFIAPNPPPKYYRPDESGHRYYWLDASEGVWYAFKSEKFSPNTAAYYKGGDDRIWCASGIVSQGVPCEIVEIIQPFSQ